MAKLQTMDLPHIFLQRLKEDSEEVDFLIPLSGPYDVTKHIDAWGTEAGLKGRVLLLTAQLLPGETFYPEQDQNQEREDLDNGTESR